MGVIDWGDGGNPIGYSGIISASHTYGKGGEYNINIYPYIDPNHCAQFGIHSEWDGNGENTVNNYITKINNIPKTCNNISGLCAYAAGFTTLSNRDAYLFSQCNTDGTFYGCSNLSSDLVEVFDGTEHRFISMENTFTSCSALISGDNNWFKRLSEIFWNNYSNIMINSKGCFSDCYDSYISGIPSIWGGENDSWKKIYYQDIHDHMIDNSKHLVEDGYLNSLNQTASSANSGNIVVAGSNGQLTFSGIKDTDLSAFKQDISALKQKFGNKFISILSLIPNGNDGKTDVTATVNTALTTLKGLGGGTLFFPPGTYLFSDSGFQNKTELIEIPSNISIMGAGKQTILRFDTSDTKIDNNGCCFLHLVANSSNILFSNLTIRGGLFKDEYYSQNVIELSSKEPWKDKDLNSYLNVHTTNSIPFNGDKWIVPGKRTAHALGGSNISNVTFDNVTFESCRYMAITFTECKNVKVVNCTFSHVLRDGVHLKNCKNSIISNNRFYRVLDDAIAIHTMDDSLAAEWNTPGLTNVKRNTTYHC